ncbi:MAG TPA: hypothetical protein VMI10_05925 [Terriglobales bacterium]|nr:hypothetical protein [Terriglobales bacterium]
MLPALEDAHSIQLAITRVIAMTLDMIIDKEMASTVLYALQIASSNLKRMDLETPLPKDVAVDVDEEELEEAIFNPEHPHTLPVWHDGEVRTDKENRPSATPAKKPKQPDLPPGTIQACAASTRKKPARSARATHCSNALNTTRSAHTTGLSLYGVSSRNFDIPVSAGSRSIRTSG